MTEGGEVHKKGKITAQFGELVVSSDFDSGIDGGSLRGQGLKKQHAGQIAFQNHIATPQKSLDDTVGHCELCTCIL